MASVRRFLQPPPGSFFLFGPRGTGKSTWLQQEFPEALRVDLLAPEVLRAYQAKPERLAERIAAAGATTHTVVMDEVQKAPQLLDVVHALVEQRRDLRHGPEAPSSASGAPDPDWRWISSCMAPICFWPSR